MSNTQTQVPNALDSNALLASIAASLEAIAFRLQASAVPTQALGFVEEPRTEYIYCNVTKGDGKGWYRLVDNQAQSLPPTFWGTVQDITFPVVQRRGQDVAKFNLHMRGDNGRAIVFECGAERFFARAVMVALSRCNPAALRQPIKIFSYVTELQTGDKTLSAALYTADGTKLDASWKKTHDWAAIARRAKDAIYLARGVEPKPDEDTPF
jgi:hypothetical protein